VVPLEVAECRGCWAAAQPAGADGRARRSLRSLSRRSLDGSTLDERTEPEYKARDPGEPARSVGWQEPRPLESQADWGPLASFMSALAKEGFVIPGGPLEGTSDVLLVVRARTPSDVRARLAEDPWSGKGLLRVTRVAPWTLRLGSLQ